MGISSKLHDYDDTNSDNFIWFIGYAWSFGLVHHFSRGLLCYAQITSGSGDLQNSIYSGAGYYWKDSCGYFNSTYSLDVDSMTNFGITTVECNISDVLLDNEQNVYTYAADVGDTQITLTC